MPAGMISTGPADVFCSTGVLSPFFLGTAEAPGLNIDWVWDWAPHMNDLAGVRKAYDHSYQGKSGVISGVLTRLDWNNLAILETFGAGAGALPGVDRPGDRGTLVMTENRGIELFLRFPFSVKFAGIGLVPGLRFPVTRITRESWQGIAPGAASVPLTWEADAEFDPTYIDPSGLGWGRWLLFDSNISALPPGGG